MGSVDVDGNVDGHDSGHPRVARKLLTELAAPTGVEPVLPA